MEQDSPAGGTSSRGLGPGGLCGDTLARLVHAPRDSPKRDHGRQSDKSTENAVCQSCWGPIKKGHQAYYFTSEAERNGSEVEGPLHGQGEVGWRSTDAGTATATVASRVETTWTVAAAAAAKEGLLAGTAVRFGSALRADA